MTIREKKMVDSLRRKGMGYGAISTMLKINRETVKSHCRRHPVEASEQKAEQDTVNHYCRNCGSVVKQTPGKKEKSFCSDFCRNRWWSAHLDLVHKKAYYDYTCLCCGVPFTAYGNKNRKYCSHECYIKARFGKEGDAPAKQT